MKTLTQKLQSLKNLDIDEFQKEFTKISAVHNSKEEKKNNSILF